MAEEDEFFGFVGLFLSWLFLSLFLLLLLLLLQRHSVMQQGGGGHGDGRYRVFHPPLEPLTYRPTYVSISSRIIHVKVLERFLNSCRWNTVTLGTVTLLYHKHIPNHQRWYAKWKLSWNTIYTLHTRLRTFGANLYAQSVIKTDY